MSWTTSWPAVALAALTLATGGCGALRRAHDCESVVEIVNEGLANIRFEAPDAGRDGPAYERIASTYEDLGRRLAELPLSDGALSKAVASYRELIERVAKHSRDYARELSSPATSKAERKSLEQRLKRIRNQAKTDVAREAALVRKINTVCAPQ